MGGKGSVYVSSTFEDLKLERAEVHKTIVALGAVPIAMEDYGASPKRPLDKCIADVREADVYVGIVGWRHGHCPPETPGVSITEAEFEAAGTKGIPRLLYFASNEQRPPGCGDADPIHAFRKRVSSSPLMRAEFKTPTDLVRMLSCDLPRELPNLAPSERLLLPYLCNREAQIQILINELAEPGCEPLTVCFLHGASNQSLARFVACIREVHLSEWLGTKECTRELDLAWPEVNPEKVAATVRRSLARSLSLPVGSPEERVRDAVAHHPGPVLVTLEVPTRAFAEERARLDAALRYFKSWPGSPRKPDLVVISFQYPPPETGLRAMLGLTRGGERLEQQLRGTLEQLGTAEGVLVLPELASIRLADATRWARGAQVRKVVREGDLEKAVSQMFGSREQMPMEELATELDKLLNTRRGGSNA